MTPHAYNTPELELLREMDKKQDRLIERLFGDLDNENPKARFPSLESEIRSNTKRITKLETVRTKLFAVGTVIGTIGGYLAEWLIHHGKL